MNLNITGEYINQNNMITDQNQVENDTEAAVELIIFDKFFKMKLNFILHRLIFIIKN